MEETVNTKKCSKCGQNKALDEFHFRNDSQKYRNECIDCFRLGRQKYHAENKEVLNAKASAKNAENPQKNRDRVKKWRKENPEKRKIQDKRYQKKHKDELNAKSARWRILNPKKTKEIKKKQRARPEVKILDNLRKRVKTALKNEEKKGSAVEMIGCTGAELKQHLEKQFYPNPETGEMMTWENYGFYGWHIDHIIPFAAYDLKDIEQLKKVCHYTNLQPLWAKENLSKSDKF